MVFADSEPFPAIDEQTADFTYARLMRTQIDFPQFSGVIMGASSQAGCRSVAKDNNVAGASAITQDFNTEAARRTTESHAARVPLPLD